MKKVVDIILIVVAGVLLNAKGIDLEIISLETLDELETKASKGDSFASLELGKYYEKKGEFSLARHWYEKSFAGEASYRLGMLYYSGGSLHDEDKAFENFLRAAQKGNLDAEVMLGKHYAQYGQSWRWPGPDYAEAELHYRHAAQGGHVEAQYLMGCLFIMSGKGCPDIDLVEAEKWFRKAAVQGHQVAQYYLGLFYLNGNGGCPVDYAEALKWFHKAAEKGNADAEYEIGMRYYRGQGVKKDYAEAAKWFHRAKGGCFDAASMAKKMESFGYLDVDEKKK